MLVPSLLLQAMQNLSDCLINIDKYKGDISAQNKKQKCFKIKYFANCSNTYEMHAVEQCVSNTV